MTRDSKMLQLLLDAERSLLIPVGDERRAAASALHHLGLLDYRKSGRWATSEAGHRCIGGSVCLEGFIHQLRTLAERAAQEHTLLRRPIGLKVNEQRRWAAVHDGARYIVGRLDESRA